MTDVLEEKLELKERGNKVDQTTDQTGDQETGFGGDLLTDQHTDGDLHGGGAIGLEGADEFSLTAEEEEEYEELIGMGKGASMEGAEKLGVFKLKKAIIRNMYGFVPNEVYGVSSRELIQDMDTRRRKAVKGDPRSGDLVGINYGGKRVIIFDQAVGKSRLSTDASSSAQVEMFSDVVRRLSSRKNHSIPLSELG